MVKILVIDDDRDLCRIISDILEEKGYIVSTAYDGKSALSKIKTQKFNLVILDYKLSGLNGLSSGLGVLEALRQINPHLITIMISAYGTESVRLKAKELGAYAFLDKPFNINELIRVVKRALREQKRRCVNGTDLQSRDSGSSSSGCGPSYFSSGENSNNPANSLRDSKSLVS
ncbi:MAG: response regulator [Candidatus Omnitrophota bacterium]|nr:response regulator [Candidatus Omnitrophota bacterium]